MSSRRTFLKNIAMTSTAGIWSQVTSWADVEKLIKPLQADEEDFWGWVRMQYTVSANMINLNNGGVSPQPKSVQEALFRYTEMANQAPSYYLWRVLDEGKEQVRRKLADIIRVSSDEVAINRNTTESLMTVIHGLNLKKGDEVVLSKYDYPRMMNAWKAREKKDGIVLKWI
ncbi:MAG: aminotransferase class V-fold PLP-dependent enzyme, partial [Flavobacteriales bacterium]|nr:aminotransferase class V-fold PLP-dependent enzyme [Flavobacteriales bacterium]